MPELPEVETVRMKLAAVLVGQTVTAIESLTGTSLIGDPSVAVGKRIVGVSRYGKLLTVDLEGNTVVGIHLKMSGQLRYYDHEAAQEGSTAKHTRVRFLFATGDTLLFNDQRRFGWVRILDGRNRTGFPYFSSLGPEPWDITDEALYAKLRTIRRCIKSAVLDQKVLAGVGNIYANDGLWTAGISPEKRANQLDGAAAARLRRALVSVLREGIRFGGSTGRDGMYVHPDGSSGQYQEHFLVYDREGYPCPRGDGGIIRKTAVGGRGTYYCPVCQH